MIVGHSERRALFGESDEAVQRKVAAAFRSSLIPIVCIGETLAERERNETFSVLDRQIVKGLSGLSPEQLSELVVAYEPVWAIGTGRNATPEQAAEAHTHIREQLAAAHGAGPTDAIRILYGGSVKPDNVRALMAVPGVDGVLVGGASLKPESFLPLLECR